MSQFAWETEAGEQQQQQPEAGTPQTTSEEAGNLALSVDDFSALEDRIVRTVSLVKRERSTRAAAEERAAAAEAQLAEQLVVTEQTEKELNALRTERENVRQRVERLLAQLDALEL